MPLVALAVEALHRLRILSAVFLAADLLQAACFSQLVPGEHVSLTFFLALFNPLSVAASLALNTNSLACALAAAAIFLAHRQRHALVGISLALAGYISLYPLLLAVPLGFVVDSPGRLVLFTSFFLLQLLRAFRTDILAMPLCHLTIPVSKPNLGLNWYLFVEMFDHFRPLFLYVIQLLLVVHLAPIGIKFGRRLPGVAVFLTLAVVAIFKPYPNMADYGLMANSLALVLPQVPLNAAYLSVAMLLTPLLACFLPVIQWRFWHVLGYDASNYYFAAGMAWNALLIGVTLHVAWRAVVWMVREDNRDVFAAVGRHELQTD